MRKAILVIIFFILSGSLCLGTTATFTEDGTINGETYDVVDILNTATVDMIAGSVGNMYVRNSGTLDFYGGTITDIELWNSGTLNLEGASLTGLKLTDSSVFNLNTGIFDGLLEMSLSSQAGINGGQVVNASLTSDNDSITNIYNGDISWDGVDLYHATLNIYGGDVLFNGGFSLYDDAGINVFYSSVLYDKPGGIIIGYNLLDNSEFMLNQFTQPEVDQINFVPEPATLLLFGLGGLFLRKRS